MLTQARLKQLVNYDPATGVFTRKVSTTRARAGEVMGWVNNKGYLHASVDGDTYKLSRLAWLYVYGKWPSDMLDHEDNDKTNNRLSNLREADNSKNKANTPAYKTNTSGVKGVYWNKDAKKYHAQIRVNKKRLHLGFYNNITDAAAAYASAAKKHFGEFARV